jgi:uncharacterized DUF497 family protein
MEFEWDEAKRTANLAKHGFDFADVVQLDWTTAVYVADLRKDYGEDRVLAFAVWDGRLYQVAFTRRGQTTRVVSFRRASRRERKKYDP